MRKPLLFSFLIFLAASIPISATADVYNFSAGEGLPGTGTPDIENQSTGTSSSMMGSYTDSTGTLVNYTIFGMVSSSNLYGTTGGIANSTDENRMEYESGNDLFRFSSGWDSGEGVTGSLRTQMLTVSFDKLGLSDHATVDVTSMNTRGEAFETASLQWLDASGNAIGTASYSGYWSAVGTTINSDVIMNSADVWTAESTGAIDTTVLNDPVAGSNGPNDNATISASAFLGNGVAISGYKITRWLEDVATIDDGMGGVIAGGPTTTTTVFTSSLTGGTFQAVPEPSSLGIALVGLLGLSIRRRKK